MSEWRPTHWVPESGLDARASPDGALPPVARLDPWLDVAVAQVWGDWAQVVCANGWWGWVDGRVLVPRSAPQVPSAPAASAPAPAASTVGYGELYSEATAVGPVRVGTLAGTTLAARAQAGWIAALGGLAVALSALLPWLKVAGTSADGFDVPVEFLLSYDSKARIGIEVGLVMVVLGLVGALVALAVPDARWRRGVGLGAVVIASLYVFQVQRLLGAAPAAGRPGLLATIGFGVFVALAGGLALAFAPARPPGDTAA